MGTKFNASDYYSASLSRLDDMNHLKKNTDSMIFALYCSGVAVECMLRAYILLETEEFDSKHDLTRLYEKSKLGLKLTDQEIGDLIVAVKKVNAFWNNNLRYTSSVRMKRVIAHQMVRTKFKDINKYLAKTQEDIFSSVEHIIKMGVAKWNQ